MTKLQFITLSLGILGLGMIYSHFLGKAIKETVGTVETAEKQPKVEHYEYEDFDSHHKMKVSKHETWYGDTMLVTVDTTYFYYSIKKEK